MTEPSDTIASANTECPQPPRRLVTDRVLRTKPGIDTAWENRRANKMRERFPVTDNAQPLPTLNLVAPVQPSVVNPCPFHKEQL